MRSGKPAVLGGPPVLDTEIPLSAPTLADNDTVVGVFAQILETGVLTKGRQLAAFEGELAEFLGVAHVVVVSSCTAGLLLTLRCLGLSGSVVLPSFTFMVSAHAVRWNGLEPVFTDIDRHTFGMDQDSAASAMDADTAALLAVHMFGTPCDADGLAKTAAERGVPLVVDAAPAFGGVYPDGTKVGTKGTAEVFSLSPTKTFTTGEGGLVATNDGTLAASLRVGREYGNPGDFDSVLVGLNGRLPELSAALGRHNLPRVPELVARRNELVDRYRAGLGTVPGIGFQLVPAGALSTYKDFCLTITPDEFGVDRDTLAAALRAEKVASRNYFDPPVHRQTVYRRYADRSFPHSESLAERVIALPLFSHMPEYLVDQICVVVDRIHRHGAEVAAWMGGQR